MCYKLERKCIASVEKHWDEMIFFYLVITTYKSWDRLTLIRYNDIYKSLVKSLNWIDISRYNDLNKLSIVVITIYYVVKSTQYKSL